ncbi:TIGR03086 family metal-binding protein [Prescottella sp. R16]|uniref:TIGR03086 family metal-binding protein n=1 Tax=Prescottella sp. R16 TaxID=3064529 RepID=UPI00272E808A|nr:TIGR03086 family metal-binding protein [Prescottella sp. R16]
MTDITDPRPLYRDALAWVATLMGEVRPDQLTQPTPCDEFDVATLMGHLVATVDRARVIGAGGDPASVPLVATAAGDDGDWTAAYRAAGEKMWVVWDDDALLAAIVTAPWGRVPGQAAIWGYLNETLVHGWDLAVATGQPAEADPALVEAALAVARRAIPASPRGGHVPFGAVIEPAAGAGPTERLANWSGRADRPVIAA